MILRLAGIGRMPPILVARANVATLGTTRTHIIACNVASAIGGSSLECVGKMRFKSDNGRRIVPADERLINANAPSDIRVQRKKVIQKSSKSASHSVVLKSSSVDAHSTPRFKFNNYRPRSALRNQAKFSEHKMSLAEIRYGAKAMKIVNVVRHSRNFSEGLVRLKVSVRRHFTDKGKADPLEQLKDASMKKVIAHLRSEVKGCEDGSGSISKSAKKALSSGNITSKRYLDLVSFQPASVVSGLCPELVESYDLSGSVSVMPVDSTNEFYVRRARILSKQLLLEYIENPSCRPPARDLILVVGENLFLDRYLNGKRMRVSASFLSPSAEYRRRYGIDKSMPIIRSVKTCGLNVQETKIFDGTGGLGTDAFTLASYGFNVLAAERNPVLYALLYDAIETARQVPTLTPIIERLTLVHADTFQLLPAMKHRPDVIYLDPMYPQTAYSKSLPKKAMNVTRKLNNYEDNTEELLKVAKNYSDVVVLKRPARHPISSNCTTFFKSKLVSFEVYKSLSSH